MIKITPESLALSALTLAIGAAGAFLGQYAGLPAPILTGPALAVTLAGLLGLKLDIVPILRNAAYVVVGVGLGALVTDEATEAITRWPIAFVAMGVGLFVTMAASQFLLAQVFGFDRKAAVLASAPGHLSYVIGLGASLSVDLPRVTIVQSLRLLTLSLIVPLFARLFGVEVSLGAIAGPDPMPWFAFFVLLGAAVIIGAIALRWKLPAALLVGAMCTSGAAHGLGWVHGGLHPMIANTGFCVLGTLIGTRFSGVNMQDFLGSLAAGILVTGIASIVAFAMAWPVAIWLDMPLYGVVAAFAPGGFEVMIALGAVLGANPGLVAACHLIRLFVLTALVPAFLMHAERRSRL